MSDLTTEFRHFLELAQAAVMAQWEETDVDKRDRLFSQFRAEVARLELLTGRLNIDKGVKTMTKKERQRESILLHGFKLCRVFNLPEDTAPSSLCKRVHRLETEMHRANELYCSEATEPGFLDKKEVSILRRLDGILNFSAQGIPVFINNDPRGYALKIQSAWIRDNDVDICRDWGGYGIIAPEF